MEQQYFTCDVWKGARRDTFAYSIVLHVIGLAIIAKVATTTVVSVRKPDTSHAVTLIAPEPLRVTKAIRPVPKITAPLRQTAVPVRRPEQSVAVQVPKVNTEVARANIPLATPVPQSVAKPDVRPGGFDPPKTTTVTTTRPARAVQTGGFGDPQGMPGEGKREAPLTIATLGSFNLPSGPGAGNGSGGAHGVRGTVASAGFGSGAVGSTPGQGRPQRGIAQAGFTDATVVADAPARSRPSAAPRMTPVEILYKPRPAYTSEARSLRIEGEVSLDVVFLADGGLRVRRVVSGLGHGLDESAIQAAQRIRFRPATQDGTPCDSNATVHIVFQLAE